MDAAQDRQAEAVTLANMDRKMKPETDLCLIRLATENTALRASLRELHDYLREHGRVTDTLTMLLRSHVLLETGDVNPLPAEQLELDALREEVAKCRQRLLWSPKAEGGAA